MIRLLPLFFISVSFLSTAQHQDKVDFLHGEVFIEPIPEEKKIIGQVAYRFKVLENVDSLFLDAKNLKLSYINLDAKRIKYSYDGKKVWITGPFYKENDHLLVISYSCVPKQTAYFSGWEDELDGNEQVWTQGQGKYTSHWLPSFDDMEEKVEFDLTIRAKDSLAVIANGEYVYTSTERDSIMDEWHFDMLEPMSSYLLAFVIGNYEKQELKSASGIPIENYYYPKDSLKVEPTYRYTKEIFDFLEQEIGVPYPWQNYKQVPVHDFLYAGMENTTITIFSDQYMIDSTAFVDKNYVNVNAHEMAHQWFGNLVTEKSGNHHWLHEGFATYYAYLAEKYLFGSDHFYWRLQETFQQLQDQVDRGEGQSLLDPKASSLTFYEKGAWALFMLRNEIGDVAFRQGIKSYLGKYKFKNVTVTDFLQEMETASGKNLSEFKKEWLQDKGLPSKKAKELLAEKSASLKLLVDMEAELKASQSDDIDYDRYWDATSSIHLKKHMLKNYGTALGDEIYAKAFALDTVPLRQALFSGRELPKVLGKEKLESLLEGNSYITKENALITLWQEHPEERTKYLEKTKGVIGLPNKNVRLLWLTLAIMTEGYEPLKTKEYFEELSNYTNAEYSFEIRQGAFFYLKEAFGFNDRSLLNLIKATDHHSWQFRKFTRNLLDELLKDTDYKIRLEELSKELNAEEIRYLSSKLSTK